ncbi:MAG TPA: hypothetical protein V6C88_17395 [Chroococcidiopsis sp.]
MASPQQVQLYLAHWFQLGKCVVVQATQEQLLPATVFQGDRYSTEFEQIWQRILSPATGDCYLEGTEQTIQTLLTPAWDISPCSRCAMPVPIVSLGLPTASCPCADLALWPNTDVPQPRAAVSSTAKLEQIRDRLLQTKQSARSQPQRSN